MATAVLPSHDILQNRFGPRTLHSSNPSPNSRFNNNASRCRRRKRSPSGGNRRSSRENLPSSPPPSPPQSSSKGLVMGQVKILKRGEELKPQMFVVGGDGGDSESDLCSTDRLGPDPVVLQKEVRVSDLYAGSTSQVSSPSPSELPFPAALIRIHVMQTDLRKLLKI